MSLNLIENGDLPSATPVMANYNELLSLIGKEHIRTLIDRATIYSSDLQDGWGEAYIDADGRNNSVDTGATDATFDTNKYKTTASATSLIEHDIPSGTFSDTTSSVFCTALIEDWEDGADIKFKLSAVFSGIAWDLSTAQYSSNNYDPTTQAPGAWSCKVGDSGTKLYVIGSTNDTIYQYTLSTPYDVSSASYASKSLDCSSESGLSQDFWINSAGTRVYVLDATSTDEIYSYTLSTPWDMSTGTYDSKSYVPSESGSNNSLVIADSGTKLYLCVEAGSYIYQYTLSTPYDISTASYASKIFDSSASYDIFGFALNDDGTKLFTSDWDTKTLRQYSLSSAYDISTASYDSISLDTTSQGSILNLGFSANGEHLYGVALTSKQVYQYDFAEEVNPTEVTSFLPINSIANYSAWAYEPKLLTIQLNPKSSSPTAGYPSIRGVWLRSTE